ncbi:MAG: nuclear transport factor 2 family protein [Oscillospiraceae bacterium]|jgi:hypothetical protein|nr:nuclear transport factor 2 family protein [Oscillospiraceae bacterium]
MPEINEREIIETLAAKDAIREKLYMYCRSMDRTDIRLGYAVFTEDSEADYGPYYRGSGRGFVDRLAREENSRVVTESHQLTNISIRVRGDSAGSEAYITFLIVARDEDGVIRSSSGTGRFVDEWVKRDGEWFIKKRVFCNDFIKTATLPEPPLVFGGSKTRDDPSYAALAPVQRYV